MLSGLADNSTFYTSLKNSDKRMPVSKLSNFADKSRQLTRSGDTETVDLPLICLFVLDLSGWLKFGRHFLFPAPDMAFANWQSWCSLPPLRLLDLVWPLWCCISLGLDHWTGQGVRVSRGSEPPTLSVIFHVHQILLHQVYGTINEWL